MIIIKGIVLLFALFMTYIAIRNDIVLQHNQEVAVEPTEEDEENAKLNKIQLFVACILWAAFYILSL